MNHLLQERYIGSADQHVAMGQFIKGEECVITGGCDRIVLYRIENGELVKVKEKRVFGCILGIVTVPGGEMDSFLVHFEYARVSSVFFQEDQNEFVCKALRFYEKQQYGFVSGSEKHTSFVRVDEEHGVSFLLISNTHFAVFSSVSVGSSRVFEMQKIRPRHCAIKDVVFLKGYSSCSICFLFEDTVAERSRVLVYIINEEYEMSFFYEVDSVPHGCYQLVPTSDKAFMVLGACGALFYSQWEMLGVRFNEFWSFDRLGIEEKAFKEKPVMVENGKCFVKERDIFLICESIFLRFTILGGNSRVSSVIVSRVDMDVSYNRAYSTAVYGNRGCFSTAEGLFLVTFEPERVTEEKEKKPASEVTEEYEEMFLSEESKRDRNEQEDQNELGDQKELGDSEEGSTDKRKRSKIMDRKTKEEITDRKIDKKTGRVGRKGLAKEYERMFQMAGEPEKKVEAEQREATAHRIIVTQKKYSLGEITCVEPLPVVDKQRIYMASAGSPGRPFLLESKDTMDFFNTQRAKIQGYSDIFVVDPERKTYLVTKDGESAVVRWETDVDLVKSDVSNERTILFSRTKDGYVQVTVQEIVWLGEDLKKKKRAKLVERARQSEFYKEKVIVLGETGRVYIYKGSRKTEIKIGGATAIAQKDSILYAATTDGALLLHSLKEETDSLRFPHLTQHLPYLKSGEATKEKKEGLQIEEIKAITQEDRTYLLVRTQSNEITVYVQRGSTFYKESIGNNAFYHEKEGAEGSAFGRIRVCGDLVFIPGSTLTRVLCFTRYSLIMHPYSMPIDSIDEIAKGEKGERRFVILAKGNIVLANMPSYYSYDKPFFYRKTRVDSIIQHIAYSSAKKVLVASVYIEKAYTKSMIPFTVQATTELDAEPLPAPEIPDISINPLTRGYSLKIYSHDEIRQYSKTDDLLTAVDEYGLEDNEYIACHKIVTLPDKQNTEGVSEFVIVCTTYITDEDLMARGRLIVLEIAAVVPKRDRIETRHKLKPLAAEKTKGAPTACDIVKGNIVVCIGTKLMVYTFDRNEGLKAVSFQDIHVFLTSCMVMRNIIVCGDAYKGVFLLFYQSEPPSLHLLAQSSGGVNLLKGVGMSLYGTSLSLLSYDSSNTVSIYSCSPQHILSQAGARLVSRGECKLPDAIAGLFRIEVSGVYRSVLYTKHGYIYTHKAVDQSKYVSLLDIQQAVESNLWMTLGTNPRSHWITDKPAEMKEISLKEVLQSGLMEEFFAMCNFRASRISAETGRSSPAAIKEELEFYRPGY